MLLFLRRRRSWAASVFALLACLASSAVAASDQPPSLISFTILTPTVDPSGVSPNAQFQIGVVDTNPGVCLTTCEDGGGASQLSIVHPASGQRLTGLLLPTGSASIFNVSIPFDSLAAGGTWNVDSLWLADLSGNRRTFSRTDLSKLGYGTTLSSLAPAGDQTPPGFTSIVQPVTAINSDSSATVLVDFEPYDGGLCNAPTCSLEGPPSQLRFVHAGTGQRRSAFLRRELQFVGGVFSFVVRARVTFPTGSAPGLWTPEWAQFVDNAGNRQTLDATALAALGAKPIVNSTTTGDSEAPLQTLVDWLPETIDSTGGPITALFGIEAFDPETGLCLGSDECSDFGGSSQVIYKRDGAPHRRFGALVTDSSDIYLTSLTIPQSGAADVWRPDQLMLVDGAGNRMIPEPHFGIGLFSGALAMLSWGSARCRRRGRD